MVQLGDWRTEFSLNIRKTIKDVMPITILFPKILFGKRYDFNLEVLGGHIAFHFALSSSSGGDEIIVNRQDDVGKWAEDELRLNVDLKEDSLNEILVDFDINEISRVNFKLNGNVVASGIFVESEKEVLILRHSFQNCRYRFGTPRIPYYDWRVPIRKSGYYAGLALTRLELPKLRPGITALIRAKNEERNVRRCLESIAPLVDEVVFVDNDSTDATLSIAHSLQSKLKNVRVYRYNLAVPRVGTDHADAVASGSTNTLGHYYNWCLSKCRTYNFIKWDCDFVAIPENFIEMRDEFRLRFREDMVSVWCGGVSLYKYKEDFYHETDSHYNEFRVHSLKNGAAYVNLPNWEEMDQYYLYTAIKYVYSKPVFGEVFDVGSETLEDRGIVLTDVRDVKRDKILKSILSGHLPDNLTLLAGIENTHLANLRLSAKELELAAYMLNRYGSLPAQVPAGGHPIPAERIKQPRLAVMVVTHQGNLARQEVIRKTWKLDFQRFGIPVYFVIGSACDDFELKEDVLSVSSADWYENLPEKVSKGFEALKKMGFNHILKVDDDCVVNAAGICRALWVDMPYAGAHLVYSQHAALDWHVSKCYNEQLDTHLEYMPQPDCWFAGGYGYLLGQEGIEAVIGAHQRHPEFLYEDALVGLALEIAGAKANLARKVIRSIHYLNADREFDNPSGEIYDIIWDVPSTEELVRIHSRLRSTAWAYYAEDTSQVNLEW